MVVTAGSSFDLWFPGESLGLMLVRDKDGRAVQGSTGPNEATDRHDLRQNRFFPTEPKKDVPRIWYDWSAGGGYTVADQAIQSGYAWAENVCTRVEGVVTPSGEVTEVAVAIPGVTLGECTASFEQDGNVYFVCGQVVVPINSGTDPGPVVTAELNLGAGVQGGDALVFDNAACVGSTDTLWRKPAGGAWSQTDPDTGLKTLVSILKLGTVYWEANDPANNVFVGRFRLAGRLNSTSRQIIHMSAPNNPLRASVWSAPITLGNGSFPINSFANAPQHLYGCTSGGVADLNAIGYSPLLDPWVQLHRDDLNNGRVSLFYSGRILYSHVQGLVVTDVGDASRHYEETFCHPSAGRANETPVYGQCTALTYEGGWIVAAIFNGTDSYVCYARPWKAGEPGKGPLVWHLGEYVIRGEKITHLRATSPPAATHPRLWMISTVNGTGAVRFRWAMLTRAQTAIQELLNNLDGSGQYVGTYRWGSGGSLFFTTEDWDDQSAKKVLLRHDIRADRLGQASFLRVFARAENGPWVQQGEGNDAKATRSPRSEILPTAPLTQGFNLQLRVDFIGTNVAPPMLREFRSRAQVIQEPRESVDYLVVLAEREAQRNSAGGWRDPVRKLRQIQRLQVREPLAFRNELWENLTVRVESTMGRKESMHWPEGSAKAVVVLAATMTVSAIPSKASDLLLDSGSTETPAAVTGTPFFWDQDHYDAGLVWS